MFQDNNHHAERLSGSRYFKAYYFSCNMFGHEVIDCNRRNLKYIRCYACNKFGNVAKECKNESMDHHKQHGEQLNKNINIIISEKRWNDK